MGALRTTVRKLKQWEINHAKQETDLSVIYENELMRGERRLAEQGNMEEAYLVMSREGVPFFMNMIRQVIREELANMLKGALAAVESSGAVSGTAFETPIEAPSKPVEPPKNVDKGITPRTTQKPEKKAEQKPGKTKKKITKDEQIRAAAIVVASLRRRGPQQLKELMDELSKHGFTSANPTVFMNRLMQYDQRIVRLERGLIGLDE